MTMKTDGVLCIYIVTLSCYSVLEVMQCGVFDYFHSVSTYAEFKVTHFPMTKSCIKCIFQSSNSRANKSSYICNIFDHRQMTRLYHLLGLLYLYVADHICPLVSMWSQEGD
jgi:hypothetical protein